MLYTKASAALVSDIYSLGATLYHMMLGQAPEEVDLSHETTTEPAERDFWVRALPQETYSDQLKRIVREMLRTSRRRRPDAVTLYQNLLQDMEVWRSESVEGRRYIRRRIEVAEEEEKVVEKKDKKKDKKKGKEAEVEVVEKGKRGGKKAEVEVVDLEGYEEGEEGEGEGEEEVEGVEEEQDEEEQRGKGKTRGGGI